VLLLPVSTPRLSAHFQLFPAGWWPQLASIFHPATRPATHIFPSSLAACLPVLHVRRLFVFCSCFLRFVLPSVFNFFLHVHVDGGPSSWIFLFYFCIFWAAIRMTFLLAHAFDVRSRITNCICLLWKLCSVCQGLCFELISWPMISPPSRGHPPSICDIRPGWEVCSH